MTDVVDALGRDVHTAYDADDRATAVTEAYGTGLARTTTTLYDAAGNVTDVVDPLGRDTRYAYDALNQVTAVTEAYGTGLARTSFSTYDANGMPRLGSNQVDATGVTLVTQWINGMTGC